MKTLLSIISIFIFTATTAQTFAGNTPEIESTIIIDEDQIILNWETEKEVNTSFFVIEFSTNGQQYEIVSSLKAKGYSNFRSDYELEIELPADSTNIRIVLVNMEGRRIAASETFNYVNSQLFVLED